jgi:hypothetical protein
MKTTTLICVLLISVTTVAATSKRGLIMENTQYQSSDLPKYLASPLLTWVYNYSPQPASQNAPYPFGNLTFVPMLWGQTNSASFLTTVQDGANYSYVLTFNEPDMPQDVGGSALSVADAVTLWNQQIQPLSKSGYKLGAPGGIHPLNMG